MTTDAGYRPLGQDGQTPVHGTRARYRKGCRCDQCRKAEAAYRRLWRNTVVKHRRAR